MVPTPMPLKLSGIGDLIQHLLAFDTFYINSMPPGVITSNPGGEARRNIPAPGTARL